MVAAGWGEDMVHLLCEACDWRYLVPAGVASLGDVSLRCPHCAAEALVALDAGEARFPHAPPPELVIPFSLSKETAAQRITDFAGAIPYAPEDLTPENLRTRVRHLFLPMWLVDTTVRASWQAEVGFNYEVVSHRERYADGAGWRTDEVEEQRVRWEPRVGRLARTYENVAAPAMEAHAALQRVLGDFALADAELYSNDRLTNAMVRAPDRAPEAAWTDAVPGVRRRAAQECRQAATADHIRDFRWAPDYGDQTWTLLLMPVYATYYLDDEGAARRVLINGQTGQIYGARRGSMQRAQRVALIIGIIALVLFLISLGLGLAGFLFPPLFVVGILGVVLALLVGIGATVPLLRVWRFNRRQAST